MEIELKNMKQIRKKRYKNGEKMEKRKGWK
jgi:hypothetical protein